VQQVLVASPDLLERTGHPGSPEDAARLPSIGYGPYQGPHVWRFVGPEGAETHIRHDPKVIADDMIMLRQAAVKGVGLAQLPLSVCRNALEDGLLDLVLPQYPAPLFEIQLLFPSRRGLRPAVRSLIDFLSEHCFGEVEPWQIRRPAARGRGERNHFWTSQNPLQGPARNSDGRSDESVVAAVA
jgi:DNA-binding transcriptional LysR family regulator